MARYYRFLDEEHPIADATTYWERDEQSGVILRAISTNGTEIMASNRPSEPWGFVLPEGVVDVHDLTPDGPIPTTEISADEFAAIWNTHRAHLQAAWEESRRAYPRGQTIDGWIEILYPQGVIITVDGHVYGLATYADTQAQAAAAPLSRAPGYRVTAVVSGYDDVNQWLLLEHAHVWPEKTHERTDTGWIRCLPASEQR